LLINRLKREEIRRAKSNRNLRRPWRARAARGIANNQSLKNFSIIEVRGEIVHA
jgi:hypothetical protein